MKKINLLILDDKIENIISLKALLSGIENLNILQSTDPNMALKICWKNDISIALVDVQMPTINGFEFVSLLKSNPKTNHILVIMVTAISKDEQYLIQGLKSGAVDYLSKPLNTEITIAKINSYINQIHIQEELKNKNQELIKSKRELIQAKKDADQARKTKEIFLANTSHEIRTPINGIMGLTNILKNSPLNEQQKDWVNRLENASNSLLLIINDILDISKIDSGMMNIVYESFCLKELIDNMEKAYLEKANAKGVTFHIHLSAAVPLKISTDPTRLQQVIHNLLSNSLKFTSKGSIQLCIDSIPKGSGQHLIKFIVKDTGIGIKNEALDSLFNEFQQADTGITKKHGGTGLGLAIVKRLVKLMGGKVNVKSEYGVGSEFSFECIFKEVQSKASVRNNHKVKYSDLSRFNNIKVLIAEDNDLNSFILSQILQEWGCAVDIVQNGEEAVKKVIKNDYQLIMMDTHMPIMSGFEAIKEIRDLKDPVRKQIPIITISASVIEEEYTHALQIGANDFISKPFDPILLHKKIADNITQK